MNWGRLRKLTIRRTRAITVAIGLGVIATAAVSPFTGSGMFAQLPIIPHKNLKEAICLGNIHSGVSPATILATNVLHDLPLPNHLWAVIPPGDYIRIIYDHHPVHEQLDVLVEIVGEGW